MKQATTILGENQGTPPQYTHYMFGFAQCVHIPHHVRQVGPLYFKTPRKLFCICYDGNKKQHNCLIEDSA